MNYFILMAFLLTSTVSFAQNTRVQNFTSAKKIIKKYPELNKETLYCGCKIVNNKVDMASCGYVPPSKSARAGRIEIEHVVAHSFMARSFKYDKAKCGKKNKRKCLEDTYPELSFMVSDLYNLYPEDGLVNAIRSNKPHEEIDKSDVSFGKCDIKTNKRSFTPRSEAKGIVARIYLYMQQSYPKMNIISNKNKKLYDAWDKIYPVTKEECERVRLIKKLQLNENSVVESRCKEKNL